MQTTSSRLITIQMTEAEAQAIIDEIIVSDTDSEPLNALYNEIKSVLEQYLDRPSRTIVDSPKRQPRPFAKAPKSIRRNGHGKAGTVTCSVCGKEMKPQGIGPHMKAKHRAAAESVA